MAGRPGRGKLNLRLGRKAEEDALLGAIHRNGGGADIAARIIKPGRAQGVRLGLELERSRPAEGQAADPAGVAGREVQHGADQGAGDLDGAGAGNGGRAGVVNTVGLLHSVDNQATHVGRAGVVQRQRAMRGGQAEGAVGTDRTHLVEAQDPAGDDRVTLPTVSLFFSPAATNAVPASVGISP